MYDIFLKESILRKTPNPYLNKAVKDAKYQEKLYTGKNQDDILTEYRQKESENQKNQRKRITISRTKHVVKQIENELNKLDIMDKPAVSVITKSEEHFKKVTGYIYENNVAQYAFEMVKHYNIVDANAFLVCRMNVFNEIEFVPVLAENVYDMYCINGVLKAVVFCFTRKVDGKEVKDYELYHGEGVLIYSAKEGKEAPKNAKIENGFIIEEINTKKIFAFQLGFIRDVSNRIPTCLSILDAASELFKSLIWQGSELDVDVATHGILQKFAYAPKCNFSTKTETANVSCHNGYLFSDNTNTGNKCSQCNGSGLQIHTTSQDIITYPFPSDPSNAMKLSDLTHTVFAQQGSFDFKKQSIKELQDEIVRTVFNSSIITKNEIAATATEKVIELQGVYSTLNQLSKRVSECFIWMIECFCSLNFIENLEVIHGYTLNLKLESVETLAAKRKQLIDANAPIEIIKGIDLAIIQKQHMDSPAYVNRLVTWEQYRPFADKSDDTALQILAALPETNYHKILYNYWGQIKRDIEKETQDKFFEMSHEQRLVVIDKHVKAIADKIQSEFKEPERVKIELPDEAK